MKLSGGQIGAAIGIGVAVFAIRGGFDPKDWHAPANYWYWVFSALFIGILALFIWPSRRDRGIYSDAHEGMDNGLAFRFGKALNRILRRG